MAVALKQLVTIEVSGRRLALPAGEVREIVACGRLTTVPQAPDSLLGLANVRGAAVAVLSLGALLDEPAGSARRIVVMEGATAVGLAVDAVLAVVDDTEDTIAERIDIAPLIARSFAGLTTRSARRGERVAARRSAATARVKIRFLSVIVGGQVFALPLDSIEAVLPLGNDITAIPDAEAAVVGMIGWRNALLPLLSLGVLLHREAAVSHSRRVLVVRVEGHAIGLVVDAIGQVVAIDEADVDPVPAVLLRGGGEARIAGIARLDNGRRLLSLLSCDTLLDVGLAASLRTHTIERETRTKVETVATVPLLTFSIGGNAYGLPLTAIDEVARLPNHLTPLPRAPDFVRGAMHLRGRTLVVIDQAARFGDGDAGTAALGKRLIVAKAGGLEAGFLVDAVTGVVRVQESALLAAPAVGADPQIFETLYQDATDAPFTLLMSPFALLAQVERDLLVALGDDRALLRP